MYRPDDEFRFPPVWSLLFTLFVLVAQPYVLTLHLFLKRGQGLGYYWGSGPFTIPGLVVFNYVMCVWIAHGQERRIDHGWPLIVFLLAVLVLGTLRQWKAWRAGSTTLDRYEGDCWGLWRRLRVFPIAFCEFLFEPLVVLGAAWVIQHLWRPLAVHLAVGAVLLFLIRCIQGVIALHTRRAMRAVQSVLRQHNPGHDCGGSSHGTVRAR